MIKINLARSAGFCFGVKRAIDLTLKTAANKNDIGMLGDIVHNEDVVARINAAGIKTLHRLKKSKGKTLLIRAHGAPAKTIERARAHGYAIIDATCPMVKEIHTIARESEKKGYTLIVIGDQKHDEVRGIVGQLKKKALVIDDPKDMPSKKIKKATIVVQSTQNIDKALKVVERLRPLIKNLKFFNTVCRPTRIKQKEIQTLPLENDIMIIIGSKTSANTKRLYEISKGLNKRSYWVRSKKDIKPAWFRKAKSVGITAGASTPDETTQEVIKYIRRTAG
ncbi:4-hydroxy-3-methylbut-2-enyl diphosphate reductase [Candidatus Omnitrophota bacterium]